MNDRTSVTIAQFVAKLAPVWLGIASIVGQPECVRAQATLAAIVADASSRDFLPGVEVRVVQLQRSAKTDFFGEARVAGIAAGQYRIEARLLGYRPEAVDLPFRSGDTVRVTFLLTRIAAILDTTRVTAANVPSHLSEFETRRSLGTGRFLTETDLMAAANSDLGRLIAQRFPGLRAVSGAAGQGTYLFSTRGGTVRGKTPNASLCPIQVYRDGMRSGAPQEATDLSDLKPQSLSGVEFYNETSTPATYRSGNVCGVLLIWTK
ncbi:MAG TPA: carboxypeptidase regulatory-like domain-containing protein [Gemmatimonadaceae bacterium]